MEIAKSVRYQHRIKEVVVKADITVEDKTLAYIDVDKEVVQFSGEVVPIHVLRNIVSHWSDLIKDNQSNSEIINK